MGEVFHAIRVFFEQLAAVQFGALALAETSTLSLGVSSAIARRNGEGARNS